MPIPDTEAVYQKGDLGHYDFGTSPLAVLGYPVEHSVSPAMHNAALREMALEKDEYRGWRYYKFSIPPEELIATLPLFKEAGFVGLNCTIPHKTVVLPALKRIAEGARRKGAVNTLHLIEGDYIGHNTDGEGLLLAVQETLGRGLGDQPVVLLGAGGAARAAAVQCLEEGVPELWIGNRTPARLEPLLRSLEKWVPGKTIKTFRMDDPPISSLPRGAWVINATSLGMKRGDVSPLGREVLASFCGVYDMIYSPPETPLMKEALEAGIPAANGVSMLVWQGVRALEVWTGDKVPAERMREACKKALFGRGDVEK